MARLQAAYDEALRPPPEEVAPAAVPAAAGAATPPVQAELPDAPGRRSRPPGIGRRESIDDYSPRELAAVVTWIRSDGRLRTDEELFDVAMDALGFKRRGDRIDAALRRAIIDSAAG